MDPILVRNLKVSCDFNVSDFEIANNILNEVERFNSQCEEQFNDAQRKKEQVTKEIDNIESKLMEIEQSCKDQIATINDLDMKLAEKNMKAMKLKDTMKQFQLRKEIALARLSQNDANYIVSIRKKLVAYKHLTGVVWDYRNCSRDHVSGFFSDSTSKKNKYFQGKLEPDDLWRMLERFLKTAQS